MATKSELDALISQAKAKINKYKKTISDCDDKIDRLKPVYKELSEIKDRFKESRNSTKEIFAEKGTWRGEKQTAFRNAGDALDSSYKAYYQRLDAAHDAVNRKIADLKAKKRELTPLIGDLWGNITRWQAELQNLGN